MQVACAGAHDANVYEPLRVPLVHVRVCCAQVCPYATLAVWYAETDAPCATVWLLNVQDWFWGVVVIVHDCVIVGFDEVQRESATVVLFELVHETVRDCVEFMQVLQPPVCHE